MGELKNVERIEQETHEKTWFERFRSNKKQFGFASAILGTSVVATNANAAEGTVASIAEMIQGLVTTEVTAILNSQKAIYGLLIMFFIGLLIWSLSKRTVRG